MAKATKTNPNTSRTRVWTFISYEPLEKVEEYLRSRGIPCAYQVHDKDTVKLDNGLKDATQQKPTHIHIILSYSSVKSLTQVREDYAAIAANGYVEPVRDTRAAVRYLSHLDNPEKAQYDTPKTLNGLDISKHIASTDKEKDAIKAMKDLITYIRLNDIMYYNDLLDMLDQDGADELYKAAISRKLITPILAYLKAMDTQRTRQLRAQLDALH